MFSQQELVVIETIARCDSFSAAAKELHKVPSAISYTVRQVEQRLAVALFERHHREVALTPAGEYFVGEIRAILKQMDDIRFQTQRVANGWQSSLTLALDNVVREERAGALVRDFYRHFPDVELLISMEVFNGVWDALSGGRADIAIGATRAIPVGGNFAYRDMGMLAWRFVVSPDHPLVNEPQPLSELSMAKYPAICLEDTSRILPKRTTWLLDNQRRLVVPNWHSAAQCFKEGLGVGVMPAHMAEPLIEKKQLVALEMWQPHPDSPCCLAWNLDSQNPALAWLLEYLGDSEQLHQEWLA